MHATTVFNVYEALFGAYAIKDEEKREKAKDKLKKAISRMKVLDFDYTDAVKAAELGGTLAHKGKHVGADAIIAAIAINKGCDAGACLYFSSSLVYLYSYTCKRV